MVRAATWLHFGSGGAARARVSTTVTSMPRHARSIASVSPTGPAPTISTSLSVIAGIYRFACRTRIPSFQFGARILDDDRPAIDFALHIRCKAVRRRSRQRFQRDFGELGLHDGIGHQLADLPGQLIDDQPRHT